MSTPTESLNPNHPTVQAVEFQWHKICALAMLQMGTEELFITDETIIGAQQKGIYITIKNDAEGIRLKLVDEAEAHRLAREHGGLPQ